MTDTVRVELAALARLHAELQHQIDTLPDASAVAVPAAYGSWAEARWLTERNRTARDRVTELRDDVARALADLRLAVDTARQTYSEVDSSAAHRARAQSELAVELRTGAA